MNQDFFLEDFLDDPDMMAGMGAIIGFVLVFGLILLAFGLVLYILRSIALYKLAENRGMSNPGLAWIPFIGIFRAGSIADDISARSGSKTYFRHFILGGYLVSQVVSAITSSSVIGALTDDRMFSDNGQMLASSFMMGESVRALGGLIGLAVFVITIIALNKIYKCYNPTSSTSWTVLSVIFSFMQAIFLFIIRNRVPADGWYGSGQNYYPDAGQQNWQAPPPPPGYQPPLPYAQQNGAYPPVQAPPPNAYNQQAYQQPQAPSPDAYNQQAYQPPQAPNPPEPWEIPDSKLEPPPEPPWNSNDNPPNGK